MTNIIFRYVASSAAICGNAIVEAGEDCDCGAHCDTDRCCNPAGSTNPCKYAPNALCRLLKIYLEY